MQRYIFILIQTAALQHVTQPRTLVLSQLKQRIDVCWARAHYYGNWSFRMLDCNPYALEAMTLMLPGYRPPERRRIGNELLEAEYKLAMMESSQMLEGAIYVSIVTDGWSNIRYEGMSNIVVTTPIPFLYKVVDDSLQRKTGEYLSAAVLDAISHLGPTKIAGVVTDNASNMKKMWQCIQLRYPQVVCCACAAHTLNLVFCDIFSIDAFNNQWDQVVVL